MRTGSLTRIPAVRLASVRYRGSRTQNETCRSIEVGMNALSLYRGGHQGLGGILTFFRHTLRSGSQIGGRVFPEPQNEEATG